MKLRFWTFRVPGMGTRNRSRENLQSPKITKQLTNCLYFCNVPDQLDRKYRFLLKTDVEVLNESEPMPFNIMEGMLSLLLSNYNHVHNMTTVFKHNGNFMSFPPF